MTRTLRQLKVSEWNICFVYIILYWSYWRKGQHWISRPENILHKPIVFAVASFCFHTKGKTHAQKYIYYISLQWYKYILSSTIWWGDVITCWKTTGCQTIQWAPFTQTNITKLMFINWKNLTFDKNNEENKLTIIWESTNHQASGTMTACKYDK